MIMVFFPKNMKIIHVSVHIVDEITHARLSSSMDDYDDYVLTPLTETEEMAPVSENNEDDDDNTVMAAEDYVQSLVTIESNWANGKISKTVCCYYFSRLENYNM